MKILLKEDVEKLGLAGEVHKVADGFGRNFLIPRGLGVIATPDVIKQAEKWRERAALRRAQIRSEYATLFDKVNGLRVEFEAKAGEKGKLYGSITSQEIAAKINQTLGITIDRRDVLSDPLRQLGDHQVTVRLSGEFQPQVTVAIRAEGASATVQA